MLGEHHNPVRLPVLLQWITKLACFHFFFFFIKKRETLNFKVSSVVYSWKSFMKISLLLIPEMGFHPTNTVNSIAGRCRKVPKRTGGCRYLIFLWVIHGLFPFHLTLLPLHLPLPVTVCLCFFSSAPPLEMCKFRFCCVAESVMEYKNSWWGKRRLSKCSLMPS